MGRWRTHLKCVQLVSNLRCFHGILPVSQELHDVTLPISRPRRGGSWRDCFCDMLVDRLLRSVGLFYVNRRCPQESNLLQISYTTLLRWDRKPRRTYRHYHYNYRHYHYNHHRQHERSETQHLLHYYLKTLARTTLPNTAGTLHHYTHAHALPLSKHLYRPKADNNLCAVLALSSTRIAHH